MIALAWPCPTALVLVLIVASWAVVGAFGVALFALPGVGAITLALVFGLFNLIYGNQPGQAQAGAVVATGG